MIQKIVVLLITIVLFSSSPAVVFAQLTQKESTPTPIPYELSYPGLLPDNPLYFLKQARDNMMAFFIGKPLEKSAFLLLQADKQASAGRLLLIQKKDIKLATKSFTDAQKNFEESIAFVKEAKKQGMATQDMIQKLQIASKKHHELLDEAINLVSADERKKFDTVRNKADSIMASTASLHP